MLDKLQHRELNVSKKGCKLVKTSTQDNSQRIYKKDRKTISLANPYTPNQLIVFDGKVPHTIKSQNLIGPSYRFTISLFFNKK